MVDGDPARNKDFGLALEGPGLSPRPANCRCRPTTPRSWLAKAPNSFWDGDRLADEPRRGREVHDGGDSPGRGDRAQRMALRRTAKSLKEPCPRAR